MSIEGLFTSKKLFMAALLLIIVTGSALLFRLSQFEEPTIVSSNIESSFIQETDDIAVQAEPDENLEPEEPAPSNDVPTAPTVEAAPSTVIQTLSCSDCTFAAVDKQHSLPASYTPSVVSVSLTGGGSLTPQARDGLIDLFAAAQAQSLNLAIISSYRSYQTQQQTFNYWVSTERAAGLSQAEAEAQANTYSARPGQSEHQLGTTADLKCAGCADFDATQNQAAYDFIAANAHKHGFVISYPPGQGALTGYTYEPWHVRWIGTDLATELFNTGYTSGNGNYVAKFLRDKGLSS